MAAVQLLCTAVPCPALRCPALPCRAAGGSCGKWVKFEGKLASRCRVEPRSGVGGRASCGRWLPLVAAGRWSPAAGAGPARAGQHPSANLRIRGNSDEGLRAGPGWHWSMCFLAEGSQGWLELSPAVPRLDSVGPVLYHITWRYTAGAALPGS